MRTAAVLGLLALTACGSQYRPVTTQEEQTVRVITQSGATAQTRTVSVDRPRITALDMPIENAWRALPAAYAAVGIEVARTDVNRAVIGNPGFRVRRRLGDTPLGRYLDCGNTQGNPSAETYEVHLSVMSELTRDQDGKTVLSTLVDGVARPVNFPGDPVRCLSKGELENRIAAVVREAAG
jgi:hypothetical protein